MATVADAPLQKLEISEEAFLWCSLASLPVGAIDRLVVDGRPDFVQPLQTYTAGPILIPRLSPEARVLVDEANRADEKEMVQRWLKAFPKLDHESRMDEKGLVVLSHFG